MWSQRCHCCPCSPREWIPSRLLILVILLQRWSWGAGAEPRQSKARAQLLSFDLEEASPSLRRAAAALAPHLLSCGRVQWVKPHEEEVLGGTLLLLFPPLEDPVVREVASGVPVSLTSVPPGAIKVKISPSGDGRVYLVTEGLPDSLGENRAPVWAPRLFGILLPPLILPLFWRHQPCGC